MDLTTAVINTSWLTAILCFIIAAFNFYFSYLSVGKVPTLAVGVSWLLFGLCFILTQFGGDWFVLNQRAYFRIATNIVLGGQLYAMYQMYKAMIPLITSRRQEKQNGESGLNSSQ